MKIDTRLSKMMAHALRHEPESYGLKLDEHGWVALPELVGTLKKRGFRDLSEAEILAMMEHAEKKRFENDGSRIRAFYGHSIPQKIVKPVEVPPVTLFHGTIKINIESIKKKGLLPMGRQYVHLSEDVETAEKVANRRKGENIILVIRALDAHNSGIQFYKEENNIWLADPIHPWYIQF